MRILLIEDDARLIEITKEYLHQQQLSVDVASDGEDGLFQIKEITYDLAIVDLGLPKLDGIELITKARESGVSCPILILTARDHWQEKVAGLDAGADDYLTKPFHQPELLARINALIRRSVGEASPQIKRGPFTLDTRSQQLSKNGQQIDLTSHEYKVVEYLMLNAQKVVSKTELTEHIYDQDFDLDSNVIEVFVGRLRKKIDADGSLTPIKTIRGRGYQLNQTIAE